MEEKRNMILAIVLSMMVLLGWNYFFPLAVPPPSAPEIEQAIIEDSVMATNPDFSDTDLDTNPALSSAKTTADNPSPRVIIDDPAIRGSIALRGARIDEITLNDYFMRANDHSENVTLLHSGTSSYFASYGWLGNGITFPDSNSLWQASSNSLRRDAPVTLRWQSPEGVIFQQVLTLEDRYLLRVEQSVINHTNKNINVSSYGLISRGGTPETSGFYILHEGSVGVLGDTLNEKSYDDVLEEGQTRIASNNGWIGFSDKYWLAALIPTQGQPFEAAFSATDRGIEPRYQTDFKRIEQNVFAGSQIQETSHLFLGAKETSLLDRYRDEKGFHQFDLAIDFGLLYFITKPLIYALHWLFAWLGNFGLAILALTVCIKLVFFPLSNKSYVSMSKMKLLQPKMLELKEKYGEDKTKLNSEMMELYKREKVNPLSGCLPILLQIPVFFALYKVLLISIEMRHAPFYGWIHDLSAPDPLGMLTLFGLIDWQVPAALAIINLGLWPIIMGFTMWLQQRLNPTPADPIQAQIFAWMPVFFTFLLATFPAGLVIYWAWNNTLTILQQWIIMRRLNQNDTSKS